MQFEKGLDIVIKKIYLSASVKGFLFCDDYLMIYTHLAVNNKT